MRKRIAFLLFISVVCTFTGCSIYGSLKAEEMNAKGLRLFQEGEYEEAVGFFLEAAKQPYLETSDKAVYLRNAALAYGKIPLHDSAIAYHTKSMNCLKSGDYYYHVNHAEIKLYEGYTAISVDDLKTAIDIDENEFAAYNLMGLILMGEYDTVYTNYAKALHYNKKVHELYPSVNTGYVLGQNYYYVGEYEKAAEMFYDLRADYPNRSDILYMLILVKEADGDYPLAERFREELYERDPEYYETVYGYADSAVYEDL